MTKKRLKDLRDPAQQDDLQAALALLKITTPIMIASSKVFVRHPELENARVNREFARNEMLKAIDGIKSRYNKKKHIISPILAKIRFFDQNSRGKRAEVAPKISIIF
jgi:hypothetical protein